MVKVLIKDFVAEYNKNTFIHLFINADASDEEQILIEVDKESDTLVIWRLNKEYEV